MPLWSAEQAAKFYRVRRIRTISCRRAVCPYQWLQISTIVRSCRLPLSPAGDHSPPAQRSCSRPLSLADLYDRSPSAPRSCRRPYRRRRLRAIARRRLSAAVAGPYRSRICMIARRRLRAAAAAPIAGCGSMRSLAAGSAQLPPSLSPAADPCDRSPPALRSCRYPLSPEADPYDCSPPALRSCRYPLSPEASPPAPCSCHRPYRRRRLRAIARRRLRAAAATPYRRLRIRMIARRRPP